MTDTATATGGVTELPVGSVTDLIAAVDTLGVAVDTILAQGEHTWHRIGTDEREKLYRRVEQARRKLSAVDAAVVTGFQADFVMPCGPRAPRWLADRFGLTHREAKTRVAAAARLATTETTNPALVCDARLPQLTAAVRAGVLDAEPVARLDRMIAALPCSVQDRVAVAADAPVVELVRTAGPDAVAGLRPFLLGIAGVDEPYTDDDRARLRQVTLGRQGEDGMTPIRGALTPELAAVLQRLMADHATPGSLTGTTGTDDSDDSDESVGDTRSPGQRRHDALLAAVTAGYGRGCELVPGRGTTTIVAAVTLEQLAARSGSVVTDAGVRMTVENLVETCDARDFFLQVMDFHGRSLYLGRSRRVGSVDQYLALVGEEGMGLAPGAAVPPAFCQIHHITSWLAGGGTDLPNLTLVGPVAHAGVDDSRSDPARWQTVPPPVGSPERVLWIPPEGEDPARVPVITVHPDSWTVPGQMLRRGSRMLVGLVGGDSPPVGDRPPRLTG
ncbi:MAG TPA: HNH endonuclease [Corynebacterium nuruki]|uniref:HNH endonuclease n=1 Tax=Corynebacterium nuruki TaxID=1032851 RepID=A0A3D4T1A9_9CORY|nr:HNH endonuclease [Corynebacterium nuruki]